ncbi:MAG: hypothetical protein JWM71_2396 [Solirubrobacteraceae bacterium]|nr:hypothetical protein [Solirubrobacteraceae bacterium]
MKRHLALTIVAAALLAGCGSSSSTKTTSTGAVPTTSKAGVQLGPAFGSFSSLPGTQRTPPPFSADDGASLRPRLKAMGLAPLPQEGTVIHIHQHLDLFVNGQKVTVPALIGISEVGQFFSPLHTHDTSGIIHVESATASSFSLGEFFGVWGVQLTPTCIGSLCAGSGKVLKAWVNGKPLAADPTRIVLASHQEIVIAYGTPAQMPAKVPSSYAFPAGY